MPPLQLRGLEVDLAQALVRATAQILAPLVQPQGLGLGLGMSRERAQALAPALVQVRDQGHGKAPRTARQLGVPRERRRRRTGAPRRRWRRCP